MFQHYSQEYFCLLTILRLSQQIISRWLELKDVGYKTQIESYREFTFICQLSLCWSSISFCVLQALLKFTKIKKKSQETKENNTGHKKGKDAWNNYDIFLLISFFFVIRFFLLAFPRLLHFLRHRSFELLARLDHLYAVCVEARGERIDKAKVKESFKHENLSQNKILSGFSKLEKKQEFWFKQFWNILKKILSKSRQERKKQSQSQLTLATGA